MRLSALSNFGVICREKGNYDKAIELYKKAIDLYPHYSKAYSNFGNLLKHLSRFKEAETILRKALLLEPMDSLYNLKGMVELSILMLMLVV